MTTPAPSSTDGPFARRDPSFDEPQFLARAESVVPLVLRARSEQRPDLARTVVDDDMFARLRGEAAQGRTVTDGVRIRGAELVHASTDDATDTVAVRFRFEGVCYQASADGRPVGGHSADPRQWAEDWWFRRPAGSRTTGGDLALDHCQGCGAVLEPDEAGRCVACGRVISGDPSGWMLSRVADATVDEPAAPAVIVHRSRSGVAVFAVLLVVAVVAAAIFAITRTVTDSVSSVTDAVTGGSTGLSFDLGNPQGSTSTASTPTTYVTPVGNAAIKAPVNDVARALGDVQAVAGRPATAVSAIHLYEDGRIIVEMQAPDDPGSVDNFTWRAGDVTSAQGRSSVQPDAFFDATAVDVSNLESLANTALGATGIPDGIIDHPYLLRISMGLRWYIPVQSTARAGNAKTYRVAPDGSGAEVF